MILSAITACGWASYLVSSAPKKGLAVRIVPAFPLIPESGNPASVLVKRLRCIPALEDRVTPSLGLRGGALTGA
jgi:hypothetical protein